MADLDSQIVAGASDGSSASFWQIRHHQGDRFLGGVGLSEHKAIEVIPARPSNLVRPRRYVMLGAIRLRASLLDR